jgi:transmembrane sensor
MTSLGDWVAQEIPQPVTDDAARWMALLDSERCNEADRLAFARWLDEDPRHRWAFQELSEVWAQLRTLSDVRPMMDRAQVRRLPTARPAPPAAAPTPRAPRREWSTILASAFAIVGLTIHLGFNASAERFSTGTAEVRGVLLPDGSTVELNARTTLTVEMDKGLRQVRLESGTLCSTWRRTADCSSWRQSAARWRRWAPPSPCSRTRPAWRSRCWRAGWR